MLTSSNPDPWLSNLTYIPIFVVTWCYLTRSDYSGNQHHERSRLSLIITKYLYLHDRLELIGGHNQDSLGGPVDTPFPSRSRSLLRDHRTEGGHVMICYDGRLYINDGDKVFMVVLFYVRTRKNRYITLLSVSHCHSDKFTGKKGDVRIVGT